MRILIISDIHGNLEALERVLEISDGVDAVWVLGDTVGYGPNPAECLALVRKHAEVILSGNHDMAAVGLLPVSGFNSQAARAVEYTRQLMNKEGLKFLSSLAPMLAGKNITLVHGSPTNPAFDYILDHNTALAAHRAITTEVCFFGHTHLPGCFYKKGKKYLWYRLDDNESIPLGNGNILFNPGSVGQPRDGDPRASFAIADTEAMTWTQKKAEYDVQAVQAKLQSISAPPFLISRLAKGI
ncbi:MAG: metallophosphoesterase family protein [Spirochaetales bacterium]|nr:metallophosphoesterase family protein [Spirochaetales bacterium]